LAWKTMVIVSLLDCWAAGLVAGAAVAGAAAGGWAAG